MKFEINIQTLDETSNLAKQIATQIKEGDIVCLKGDLGAGKTYFAGKLIQELLNINTPITSPTFQLLQTYENIHHYDLYRLKSPDEAYELGIEDSLDGTKIVIIEWPEIIRHILPKAIIDIEIIIEGNVRKYFIEDRVGRLDL